MKFREVRRRLKDDGFVIVAQRGSHEQWSKQGVTGRVTVAGQNGEEVKIATLKSIFLQAGWTS